MEVKGKNIFILIMHHFKSILSYFERIVREDMGAAGVKLLDLVASGAPRF